LFVVILVVIVVVTVVISLLLMWARLVLVVRPLTPAAIRLHASRRLPFLGSSPTPHGRLVGVSKT
jgi:hypothetical protein